MNLIAFIPAKALENVRDLINKHELNIITVSERKTKRGDFRVYSNGAKKITLNKDSNKFRFLITFLHETAHQLVFQTFGSKKNHPSCGEGALLRARFEYAPQFLLRGWGGCSRSCRRTLLEPTVTHVACPRVCQ